MVHARENTLLPNTTQGRPILTRYAYLPTCTLGYLAIEDRVFHTIERPWVVEPKGPGGMHDVSCVPDGKYKLEPHDSAAHPDTFALVAPELGVYHFELPYDPTMDAPQRWGRTACLFHPGNGVADVNGCIAPGLTAVIQDGEHRVLVSRRAMEQLQPLLGRWLEVEIRPTRGTA